MRTRHGQPHGLLCVFLAGLSAACSAPRPLAEGDASVTVAAPALFYESGERIPLSFAFYNAGDQPLVGGTEIIDGKALEVRDGAGRRLSPADTTAGSGGVAGPLNLPPGERREVEVNLAALYPGLAEPGAYALTAVYPRFRSNAIGLRILPRYRQGVRHEALVETDRGSFTLRLFPDTAPNHVRNFVDLGRLGFYDNTLIHRIVPGRLIQGGDPGGTGTGGPGYKLAAEFNSRPHLRGTLSMARHTEDSDSAGSQWFICLDRLPEMDGRYTVFGEVVEGMDSVDRIAAAAVRKEVPQEEIRVRRVTIREAPL